MKNLKKISRKDLKNLYGGKLLMNNMSLSSLNDSGDTFKCCNKTTGSCGPCGGPGACDDGYELRSC